MPARAWLMARPIPLPPPVTSAVLPSRSPIWLRRGRAREVDEELFCIPGVNARDVLRGEAGQHPAPSQLDAGLHLHRSHPPPPPPPTPPPPPPTPPPIPRPP